MFFLIILLTHFFALLVPGPDFFYVLRVSLLNRSRQDRLMAVAGIVTGVGFWILLSLFGLKQILAYYPWLYKLISILGASYLLYMAYEIYRATSQVNQFKHTKESVIQHVFRKGLFCNLSNVKAIIFFSSIFVSFPQLYVSHQVQFIVFLLLITETFLWFYLLSYIFATEKLRKIYLKFQKKFDYFSALFFVLVALGIIVKLINS